MSRIAKLPIIIPDCVEIIFNNNTISVKGINGILTSIINTAVKISHVNNELLIVLSDIHCNNNWAIAGTMRALLNNMIIGVTQGFTKKLQLVGIGYRVTLNSNIINLLLGYSHTINYKLPIEITAECPNSTEIILKSINKQILGQTAAELRAYRPPDPYKGKGIRYADEIIKIKEIKKK